MTDFEAFINAGGEDLSKAPVKKSNAQKFPCGQCAGTGRWSRGINRNGESKCFACRGTGYFKTDPRKLAENRAKRHAKKAKDAATTADKFNASNPELVTFLTDAAGWSGFAASMLEAGRKYGHLTEKQMAAATNMQTKCAANKAKREAEIKENSVAVDLTPIIEMFDAASANYKRPAYRAEALRLKPRKQGGLNVYCDERTEAGYYGETAMWIGKIVDGQFQPGRNALDATKDALLAIAADPKEAAINYGRKTGRCSCCGRELSKHSSIDAGIGPICAEKFGF